MNPFTRRDFLKRGTLFLGMGVTAPTFLTSTARALAAEGDACLTGSNTKRILVVVQLGGGNDGANSMVPYSDPVYLAARPTLAVPESDVLPISESIGFHTALSPFKELYDQGLLSVVQGVGYPNPNRSHFRSTDIWTSAVPETLEETGWLGRYLDAQCSGEDRRLHAVDIGTTVSRLFWTGQSVIPAISSIETFGLETDVRFPDDRVNQIETLKLLNATSSGDPYDDYIRQVALDALSTSEQLQQIANSYISAMEYPETRFADGLRTIAKVISGDLGTRIFHVTAGGFDTHANQAASHAKLLADVSQGLQAFMRDLEVMGGADDVLVMTFSEFGRRLAENASAGTDHGAAAPLWLVGGGVKSGLIGNSPNLNDLDDGDLKYEIDFRSVYGTILQDWLGVDPKPIIGTEEFPILDVIAAPAESATASLAMAAD